MRTDKKSRYIAVRWSDRELELITKAMKELGFSSVSETIRAGAIVGLSVLLRQKDVWLPPDMEAYIGARITEICGFAMGQE